MAGKPSGLSQTEIEPKDCRRQMSIWKSTLKEIGFGLFVGVSSLLVFAVYLAFGLVPAALILFVVLLVSYISDRFKKKPRKKVAAASIAAGLSTFICLYLASVAVFNVDLFNPLLARIYIRKMEGTDYYERRKATDNLAELIETSEMDYAWAVPSLVEMLDSPDISVKQGALRDLAAIGDGAKGAMPKLLEIFNAQYGLEHREIAWPPFFKTPPDEWDGRFHAAWALLKLDSSQQDALNFLEETIHSENLAHRGKALILAGSNEELKTRYKNILVESLDEQGNADFEKAAIKANLYADSKSEKLLEILRRDLNHELISVRIFALNQLDSNKFASEEVIELVSEAARNDDVEVQRLAKKILEEWEK